MKADKLTIINETLAIRKDKEMSEKTFFYHPCEYCGEWISNCGWAHMSHYKKHVRNGDTSAPKLKNIVSRGDTNKIECPYCFANGLQIEFKEHFGDNMKEYKCKVCNRNFMCK